MGMAPVSGAQHAEAADEFMSNIHGNPVLVVEDDRNIDNLVATYLRREGFDVLRAADGAEALSLVRQIHPGFVILDVMLPEVDGWEVCRRIRQYSDVPIVMLTARGEEYDRIQGFSLGVDDYVVKPFSPAELMQRVRAILRRAGARRPRSERHLLISGSLLLDRKGHTASLSNTPLSLTPTEFRLLEAMLESPGRVLTREELLDCMHPDGEVVIDRVVDVHVGNLRKKIEDDPANPKRILTVRGVGYKLVKLDAE